MTTEATSEWWRWAARRWATWTPTQRDDLRARAAESIETYGMTVEQAERAAFLEIRESIKGSDVRPRFAA